MGTKSQTIEIEYNLEIHRTFEHGEPSDSNLESRSKILALARYVRRHHGLDKISRAQTRFTITRNKLKGTFFLTEFEPRTIKDVLNNESWIEAMNEEIE